MKSKVVSKLKCFYRIALASCRGFNDDGCAAHASSLTYYSLLSIVPVLAVAFGIARGFGFEKHLENELTQKFVEHHEVIDKLVDFANKTLQNTQSGLIAGIGLILLFWSVLKLFSNIENSFNKIWKIKKPRSFARSFSDYLAMILFCPIFFAASSSLSVFVVTQVVRYSQESGVWNTIGPVLYFSFHLFPLIMAWFLFTALYTIMPNTTVPLKYATIAGVCAGTAYQITQALYIKFQIGLSSYGAIYGSFAALPLFLIWLNISWWVALWGAEVAYHAENDQINDALSSAPNQVEVDLRVVGLVIVAECIKAFQKGTTPPSPVSLSQQIGLSAVTIRRLIEQFVEAHVLTEVNWRDHGGEYFLPARNIEGITYKRVCDALDATRTERIPVIASKAIVEFIHSLDVIDRFVENSAVNEQVVVIQDG